MFFEVRSRAGKILLWSLALALLVFVASQFPSVRRALPWFRVEDRAQQAS